MARAPDPARAEEVERVLQRAMAVDVPSAVGKTSGKPRTDERKARVVSGPKKTKKT